MEINSIITAVIVAGVFVWFFIQTKRKSKFGINLKAVYCPVCKTRQPRIRRPLNERQKLYGGWTCGGCHAELDKYGDVIK